MSELPLRRLRAGRLVILGALALGVVVLLARAAAILYVDLLWFRSVGYMEPFLVRLSWEWGVRAFVAGVTAVFVLLNLRVVVGTLGGIQIRRRFGDLEIAEQVPRSVLLGVAALISVLVGLWFAASVPSEAGTGALLLIHGPTWGMVDPVLGRDLGFYMFRLPVLAAGVTFGLVLSFFLLAVVLAAYAGTGAVRWVGGRLRMDRTTRLHLSSLGAGFLLLLAIRFLVVRYTLLLEGSSSVQGIFGYTDMEARLPALLALSAASLVAALSLLWSGRTGRSLPALAGSVTLVLGGILAGQIYPALVQRLQVEPNELGRETPHIQHNLAFTRLGFGLDDLQRRSFPYRIARSEDWEAAPTQLRGLPVWTTAALLTGFRQLDARFGYYDFPEVSVTRYLTASGPVPVALAVREVDASRIPDPSRSGEAVGERRASWQNLHLRERYITGLGAVAAAANRYTPEGRPATVLEGIPPTFSPGPGNPEELELRWPSVFFGIRTSRYAVVNPGPDAFLSPDSLPGTPGVDFPEGIPMAGALRTLAIAWRFQDWNLFLASEVGPESRFVHRREVVERARTIAPFLRFPAPPYPVVAQGRIHWILDGFTASPWFPLASAHTLEPRRPSRYVRGSVKVTVDAVTGDTRFYTMDGDDPLLQGWHRAFPGLFRPVPEMPAELRSHLRYPGLLLQLQGEVLLRYHQETAAVFHAGQEMWAGATELSQGNTPVPYLPEYGIWRLPGESEVEFLLSTVFVPAGRENLAAFLVARSDGERYGELLLFDVPVEDRVPGPRQVEALVEQDPEIAQQFSLWRQGGSQVWTGHLHLVPVGNTLLYMEPIFLAAGAEAIPELRRFVLSDGRRVVMTNTLAEGLTALSEGSASALVERVLDPGMDPSTTVWPSEALELLEQAEERLREGDFAGFGRALEELRTLLRQAAPGGG
jgi:uncharacterized protein